jgi:hypothetical protein
MKMILLLVLSTTLVGCMTVKVPSAHLSVEEFCRLYDNPGTMGDYWEYKGLKEGRHWLYRYGFKQPQQSIVTLMEKGFVLVDELPAGFPSAPQPKPSSADLDSVKAGLHLWLKETSPKD